MLFACSAAFGQERLELDSLLRQALERSPEVVAAQKRYEAARQRPGQVSALPDPMISPGYNSSGRPWPGAGVGMEPVANIGVMVSQEVPFPGKRKLMGDMASKEAEAEFQSYQQAQLSVVSRVKQAYYRLAYAYAQSEVLDRNLDLLRRFVKISEIRYGVGKAEQQDVLKAQTQVTILETRRIPVEQEKRAREAEINSLLNRRANTPLGRPVELAAVPLAVAVEDLVGAAQENSPMIRRDEKMIQRSELAVNQARKEYLPDVTLNGGYYWMGSMPNMYMFRADVKVPLYWFRKQRNGVTEQAMGLQQARATLQATEQSLGYQIRNDYTMAEAAAKLARMYQDTVLPQARLTLESSLSSYETGRGDFLGVLMNSLTVVEYEMNYWEQLQNLVLALVRLEEMTGRKLL
ncbi:MAG: TolC family protein [Bryobacterales bacterium]|nr:TolC family protein [Bryobacterales bacterium]